MSKANKKGRSIGGGRFVQIHHFMMQSVAWRSLQPNDKAVYLEIAAIYDGTNNGRLGLGVRAAAERANINKDTAGKCFLRLQERGFIECAQPGGFSMKVRHAAEWRLAQYRCDRTGQPPSKAFQKWGRATAEPGPSVSDSRSLHFGQSSPKEASNVPSFRTVGAS